ncbi:hypothetical protein RHODGE_RHODGE_00034 [Rhodoplanes serenus]|uniref:Uncharacterized protein n=1 Tax=Rhodoplanes serenus TaxID=200615 RepID=A0A3S4BTG8_9BRAD|nr:hypothetical protein RHODGE_RHODGE_00034 [Rhodoplanes serenus]
MVNRGARGPRRAARILLRLVADHHQRRDTFGGDLAGDLPDRQATVVLLPARHGDGVVEQDLEGDVDAGRDGGPDRQRARVIVGAVAEILEHVRSLRERRLADPIGPFAAHLGEARGGAIHPLDHVVAADARIGAAALRHHRGRVVRAARAEIRRACRDVGGGRWLAPHLLQAGDAGRQRLVGREAQEPLADRQRDGGGIERALDREQPAALLVLLADDDRLVGGAVQLLAHLHLDQRTLLLDHHQEIEPGGRLQHVVAADRIGAADLNEAQAEIVAAHLVEAEQVERQAHVEIALADREEAEPRPPPARHDGAVEPVDPHEGQHGVALEILEARLLGQHGVAEPDAEATRRHAEQIVARDGDLHPVEVAVDHGGGLHRVVDAFEPDPGAGVARHREAEQAVVDDLLDAGRIEHRDHGVDEVELRLVRRGGAFGGMVVTHQREHAAVTRGTGAVRMAKHIAGAIDARSLAVP